jgi:hypothetical protein
VGSIIASFRVTFAAGARQLSVKAFASAATPVIRAGAGGAGAYTPAYLRVVTDA